MKRTGVSDFARASKDLTLGWTRRLKVDHRRAIERAPEPDRETAWKFSEGNVLLNCFVDLYIYADQ